jgi:hypothetical protein
MNLVPFHTYLQSVFSDESIFLINMPPAITRGILILHNSGGAKLDANLPDYKVANIQLIVRDIDYQSGYAFAVSVLKAFTIFETTVGGIEIKYINPLHDPLLFPLSTGGLTEFSLNFKTAYVEH